MSYNKALGKLEIDVVLDIYLILIYLLLFIGLYLYNITFKWYAWIGMYVITISILELQHKLRGYNK